VVNAKVRRPKTAQQTLFLKKIKAAGNSSVAVSEGKKRVKVLLQTTISYGQSFFYFCDVTVLFAKLFYFLTIFVIDCNSLNGEDVASFTLVLNLLVIEQLWLVLKNKVKRSSFKTKDD
jgi:hypothetical protein